MSKLDEKMLASKSVFKGELLHVKADRVALSSGKESIREYIVHNGAACVVPILENGNLLMERQYRYPLRREFIELPAGKIDPGETPLATAQRELFEETGYTAKEWQHLLTLHPCIGYSDERIELFLARGLSLQAFERPAEESLEVFELGLDEAQAWVSEGKITDAKTLIGILLCVQRGLLKSP